jgi:hypothetical protein
MKDIEDVDEMMDTAALAAAWREFDEYYEQMELVGPAQTNEEYAERARRVAAIVRRCIGRSLNYITSMPKSESMSS